MQFYVVMKRSGVEMWPLIWHLCVWNAGALSIIAVAAFMKADSLKWAKPPLNLSGGLAS